MASEILGLFTSPEEYQMRQQQAQQQGQQNAAFQFAQLNPFEKASYGIFQGAQQLGSAGNRLFGGEDPQLRKISMRQQMISGTSPTGSNLPALDFNDPVALRQASAFALQRNRDPEFAQFLQKKADEVELNRANITAKLREKPANVDKSIQIAQTRAELQDTIARLEADQVANPTEERARALNVAKNTLAALPLKTEGLVREQQIARDLALEKGPEGSEAFNAAYVKGLRDLTTKTTQEKLGEFERVLNSRYPADNPDNATKRAELMDQFLTSEITGRKSGKGTQVDIGGIRVDTGKASEAAGKKIGEELVDVKNKQSALDSIADAKAILKQGIYAGAYGPAGKIVAKYTGIGSKDKVARTEEFVSYIGNVVIPRLKEFGGNDSEQELKYLNNVMGGNLEMEPAALTRILDRAEKNIQRGIERLRKQAETGETKQSLTSTLPRAGNADRPSEPAMVMPGPTAAAPAPAPAAASAAKPSSGMPKATKRWNPQTRKLEVIR
jgi:hypothetical protein